ncbi:probable inactive 1-aminocyclopropane-1-carboxylate synthase-like protein 2 [Lemur catta]|uniref:probable inactive 1-aminocyclopropane-1-carboxylate synthase-like protein 2 n=1 Tax=Lemur catta TaxID=9447 RepID=UPI001E269756|nr:probable inactive 1-aminocyclopropane-1-carboxylate synthase-like protein 2 [Lemur catta]
MSLRSDAFPVPCGQKPGQVSKDQSFCTQVLEMVLHLQRRIDEHFLLLTTTRQSLQLEEQKHAQSIRVQEVLLDHLIHQMVSFLESGATSGLEHQVSLLSLESSSDVRSAQRAQSSRHPGQLIPKWTDFEPAFVSHDLSNRGSDISVLYHSSFQDYNAYQGDKYHEDKNTLGFINLGTSENKLCIDLIIERLCRSDMNHIDEVLLQYSDWRGQPFLREEVARFLTYYCKAPARLDPENVVVLNGCCSVFSALAMVLCDPGEAFLVPTPFYGGFAFSSRLYAKVELVPVYLESEITGTNTCPFQLTVDKLEDTLLQARLMEKKVRGLVLTNPQNPLGDVYSQDSLKEYLEFAKRNDLHVIIDEIYMLSVFDESITFHSVLSMESLPDPNRTHVIWGTSKDFGISGFRFGALYTHNKEVASAVGSFGYLHGISGITQHKLCQLLQDREWIDTVYLPTNHFRLRKAHAYITNKLQSLEIPFLCRGSGLYVWINLKKYLEPCTFEEEWLLHRRFLDNKLMLSCGKNYMCKEPGWFCLIFAERPLRLKLAMLRFCRVLEEQKQEWIEKQLADAMKE